MLSWAALWLNLTRSYKLIQFTNHVASRQELGHEGNSLVNVIRQLLR